MSIRIRPRFVSAAIVWLVGLQTFSAPFEFPRSTPESQGVSSAAVREFVETAAREIDTLHSFMLVRHGRVVAEGWWKPEGPDKPHVMWSLSKSFTSTAVGLAAAEGSLSIDDRVLDFFPEEAPAEPSENLRAMRIRDLLTMTCGHESEVRPAAGESWVRAFLAHPVPHEPGTHFVYNTLGSHMLSAIVQQVTGQTVAEYLRPRLFEPLGIRNPEWSADPEGRTIGGYGLFLRTEDIARFGQLYLQQGTWEGRQLLPASWVEQAIAEQVPNGDNLNSDWNQGYGFQFWRCRHGVYRGDGKDGQFCIVLPDRDAVIAITADTGDLQGVLNIVWDRLLPAFHAAALPEDPEEQAKLRRTLADLKVGGPAEDDTAARADAAAGVDQMVALWPGAAPGETGEIGPERDTTAEDGDLVAGQRVIRLGDVSEPSLSIFRPPPEIDTGAAVLVCPGGGYYILAYDLEGTEVCSWLNSIGITGILLKYRVPARPGPDRHAAAPQDAQRAMGIVRHRAGEWGIDPSRIGVLGFSAGGHLAASLSNHQGARTYPRVDEADDVSCRPDFAVLVYPGYLTVREDGDRIAPDLRITSNTPPTFLVMAQDDPVRVENVISYAGALRKAQVPFELHVYPSGGHGYGLRPSGHAVTTWPARAAEWMKGLHTDPKSESGPGSDSNGAS